jgi:hypothetical protein
MQDSPLLPVIPVLLMILLLLYRVKWRLPRNCCTIQMSNATQEQYNMAPMNNLAAQEQEYDMSPVQSAPRVETEEERKQARRLKILTTLVHKVS